MNPKTISQMTPALVALILMLVIMPFQIVALTSVALPGCPEICGDIQIPYPFGIGPGCSLPGFELSCNTTSNGSPGPFLFNGISVLDIDVILGMVRVNKSIISNCYNQEITGGMIRNTTDDSWNLSGTPFWINNRRNTFIAIGCDMNASITFGSNETNTHPGGCITMGCYNKSITNHNWVCSGTGCCQTYAPQEINYYQVSLQYWNSNGSKQYNSSQYCGYAALVENSVFLFSSDYIATIDLYKQQMPVVLDWSIGNEACETAKANRSSYACISDHSFCYDSTNSPGYWCLCSPGYGGNPYLEGGCQGYPCPAFLRPNQISYGECQLDVPNVIGLIIGLGLGIGFSAFLLCFAIRKRIKLFEKRKNEKLKKKFFNQNRGFLLQQRMASDDDATQRMRIFSLDELERATNRFDKALILGQGGHGEVYKGILMDQRIVAIKRSKIVDQAEIEQFINEVVILSQINHRNVVKLYGCCLETEVPLLVYEFISNGTLSNHLHAENGPLTWDHRLRIALETARAIAYLHSSASISVLHRDIKSTNILLDDYFTAKVSDFGASRSVQIDQTGITTVIQGTFGYLDPEYFYTHRLTPKSDVYSFGVILAEMLTGEKPNSSTMFEVGGLVTYFTSGMRENRLEEILDPQIAVNEVHRTELEVFANLAQMCLRRNGEERPTMKELEIHLEVLWQFNRQHEHPRASQTLEERQLLPHESIAGNDTTRQYSFEQELLSSFKLPR
ncbi:Wall-associated kinase family protein [Rhynchospora pubera]|uniref:Wall-associated kinase family protein n=1 Tax=Rhynchospora pubera TaxID=906938 RepID=A0AAV8H3P2_9POAL|nr:Wall-associated kinase family protein [Rhynchospora pubera]